MLNIKDAMEGVAMRIEFAQLKHNKWSLFAFVLILFGVPFSHSAELFSNDDYHADHYFVMNHTATAAGDVDLLQWTDVNENLPQPQERYNREKHFGKWIDDPSDDTCMNTRAKVLVRGSLKPVKMGGSRGCIVVSGQWSDPYTGQDFSQARDMQIDHLVPLKQAYMTGAANWTNAERCLYANYLGNSYHLLPVSGTANLEKSDKSPAEFVPSNPKFVCQYLVAWLKVKTIWSLYLTPKEAQGIQDEIEKNSCETKNFTMTQMELSQQKQFIESHRDLCSKM